MNITDEMSELTLDIVLRSIFGRDLDRLSEQAGGNPFDVVTKDQERNLQFAFKFRSLAKVVASLMERRRSTGEEHFDYVAMLMSARDKDTGAPMSDRELIDEVMTLIVAGHETTASGLNWTWVPVVSEPGSRSAPARRDRRGSRHVDTEPRADGIAGLHAAGRERGAAFVSTGLAALPPYDRGGCVGWL